MDCWNESQNTNLIPTMFPSLSLIAYQKTPSQSLCWVQSIVALHLADGDIWGEGSPPLAPRCLKRRVAAWPDVFLSHACQAVQL